MADFSIKRNDTAPALGPFVLRDADGNAVDTTGATSVKVTVKTVGGAVKFSAECTPLDAAQGRYQYEWDPDGSDTDVAGDYEWQVQVSFANGRKQTFPTLGSMTLRIDPDADAA